jgi:lipopolysaccharide transport system permease protein
MSDSAHLPHTFIRPPDRWPGLGLTEVWNLRAICLVLVRRALKVRYRQTVIGAGWAIAQPLLLALVFTAFFGMLVRVPSDGIPYPLFVYSGMVAWQLIARITSEGSTSVVANVSLVTKIYFPRVYFPASVAITSVVDLLFGLLALGALLVWNQALPDVPTLALAVFVIVPILTAIGIAAALGIALWLGALHVAYRDVDQLLPLFVQLWFFLSPVIYPSSLVPSEYQWLYWLNPAALCIEGYRWALVSGPAPSPTQWLLGSGVAVALLVFGYYYFRSREASFVDVV